MGVIRFDACSQPVLCSLPQNNGESPEQYVMSYHIEGNLGGRAYSASEGCNSVRVRAPAHGHYNKSKGQGHPNASQDYGQHYHGSKAWWSVGELLHQGNARFLLLYILSLVIFI